MMSKTVYEAIAERQEQARASQQQVDIVVALATIARRFGFRLVPINPPEPIATDDAGQFQPDGWRMNIRAVGIGDRT